MTNERLAALLEHFDRVRLVVLGDFLIDEFLFGEISRVSREAPVLILHYQETRICPGGAANTVANAAALGARVLPIGIVGDDRGADELIGMWSDHVDKSGLIREPGAQTTRKSRILAGSFHSFQQQVVRMDYEAPIPYRPSWERKVLANLSAALEQADALVISDYSLGNITGRISRAAMATARRSGIPVIIDSRDHPSAFPGATTVTPNISEVEATMRRVIGENLEKLEKYGELARRRWKVDTLLVTRGKLGMSLFAPSGIVHIRAHGSDDAVDVTGAGDTVAATYATSLAAGADFESAARLANVSAGLVVMKKGTSTVTRDELANAMAF
ncbi:MAG: PfkB family carbohydrate kinase [Acidobacteriota bacterium]